MFRSIIKTTTKTTAITKEIKTKSRKKEKQWVHQTKEHQLMEMKEQIRMIPPTLYLVALRMFSTFLFLFLFSRKFVHEISPKKATKTKIFQFSHFSFVFFPIFPFYTWIYECSIMFNDISNGLFVLHFMLMSNRHAVWLHTLQQQQQQHRNATQYRFYNTINADEITIMHRALRVCQSIGMQLNIICAIVNVVWR